MFYKVTKKTYGNLLVGHVDIREINLNGRGHHLWLWWFNFVGDEKNK